MAASATEHFVDSNPQQGMSVGKEIAVIAGTSTFDEEFEKQKKITT